MDRSKFKLRPRFSIAVLLPIGIVVAVTVCVVAWALIYAALHIDEAAIDRQTRLVERSVANKSVEVTVQQQASAIWDEAVNRITVGDMEWINNHLGTWLNEYYNFDSAYIVDLNNEPVYAMVDGKWVDAEAYRASQPIIEPMIKTLRETMTVPMAEGNFAEATRRDITVINGRPALVALSPIANDMGPTLQSPGQEFIHIVVRFLDASFIQEVTESSLVQAARFSWIPETGTRASASLFNLAKEPIGYITWSADRPGQRLMRDITPALMLSMAILFLIVWVMARKLFHTSSELEASEAQAQHIAFHDTLTGLPNRALFNDRLEQALARVRRGHEPIALLYLDLDRFKMVNDTLGHPAGDALICEVAGRLRGLVRSTDTVVRLGGDEFAIIQTDVTSQGAITTLCSHVIASIAEPIEVFGSNTSVGISIGVATSDMGSDASELLRKADIALYQAKTDGRNCFRIFAETMDFTLQRRQTIAQDLQNAVLRDELTLRYQPVFAPDGVRMVGVEALVRWLHPTQGLLPPAAFIQIAEETGLIVPVGNWVLRQACIAGARLPDIVMAVNVSAVQMRAAGFAENVAAVLAETGMPPERLELEITESVLLDDQDLAVSTIKALHEIGVKVALDDFGTGYSSIGYLRTFAVDKIKIDRSFIKNLADDPGAEPIVQAIIGLGCAMGMQVTAEGVETVEQQRFLVEAGCHLLQGFLLSGPLPFEDIEALCTAPNVQRFRQARGPERRGAA